MNEKLAMLREIDNNLEKIRIELIKLYFDGTTLMSENPSEDSEEDVERARRINEKFSYLQRVRNMLIHFYSLIRLEIIIRDSINLSPTLRYHRGFQPENDERGRYRMISNFFFFSFFVVKPNRHCIHSHFSNFKFFRLLSKQMADIISELTH